MAVSSSYDYARQKRREEIEAQQAAERERAAQEEAERRERLAELRENTIRVILHYDAYFLPSLQSYLALPYRLDPLRKPGDAFALIGELARRKVQVAPPEYREETYKVLITSPVPAGWKIGTGIGDTLAEALIYAVWEILPNE